MLIRYFIIFLLILLSMFIILNSRYKINETFVIQYGTPDGSSTEDKDTIKSLLEIGSQAHENTKYDTVSTKLLGDTHTPTPPPFPPTPPDPICFTEDSISSVKYSKTASQLNKDISDITNLVKDNPFKRRSTCTNNIKDGNETDIDCGGPNCPPCKIRQKCIKNRDCINLLVCRTGKCSKRNFPYNKSSNKHLKKYNNIR